MRRNLEGNKGRGKYVGGVKQGSTKGGSIE
jgi:hypothetical protein